MNKKSIYLTLIPATMILTASQMGWGATSTTVTTTTPTGASKTVEVTPTTTTTAPTTTTSTTTATTTTTPTTKTIVVTRTPPPPKNFYVCYHRVVKYMTKNVQIERCNPYGMCRDMIFPVKRKITSYEGCQINTQGCYGSLSKFGWYSNGKQAKQGLAACQNKPIVVQIQRQ